jgi:hypothetical protein
VAASGAIEVRPVADYVLDTLRAHG